MTKQRAQPGDISSKAATLASATTIGISGV
jgi:hypothetical protein